MSYLRPPCSDAAVRTTNLSISRYIPAFRQGDAQPDDTITTIESIIHHGESSLSQRLPSRRPIDRRWDESRGLVFDRKKTALKNYTWSPTRGIVFGGGMSQRRSYAMRPTRGPVPLQSQTSASSPQSPSVTGQAYGSSLPSLERPTDSSTGMKSQMQVQMEADISRLQNEAIGLRSEMEEKDARITELEDKFKQDNRDSEDKISELNSKFANMRIQFQKDKADMATQNKKDKASEYRRGQSDSRQAAEQKAEDALRAEMQQVKDENSAMKIRVENAENKYPKMQLALERQREQQEAKIKAYTEAAYAKLNQHSELAAARQRQETTEQGKVEEKLRELRRMEEKIAERKKGRANYTTYRSQFELVFDERRVLDENLKDLHLPLEREAARLTTEQSLQESIQKAQQARDNMPTATQSSPATADDQIGVMSNLAHNLGRLRKDLQAMDATMKTLTHASRLATNAARFRDVMLAAEVQDAVYRTVITTPAKNIKSRTEREISDIAEQMKTATNATLREELGQQREALRAEVDVVSTYLRLMYLDRQVQYFETLKLEPYVRKAVCMGTIDLRAEMEDLRSNEGAVTVYENDEGMVSGRSRAGGRYTLASKWRELFETVERLEVPIKKRAQILEATGQHHADEKTLDAKIDAKIAHVVEELRLKRANLFASHRTVRSAARRAPSVRVRARPEPRSAFKRSSRATIQAEAGKVGLGGFKTSDAQRELFRLKALLNDPEIRRDPARRTGVECQILQLRVKVCLFAASSTRAKLANLPINAQGMELRERLNLGVEENEANARRFQEMLNAKSEQTFSNATETPMSSEEQLDLETEMRAEREKLADVNNGLDADGVASSKARIKSLVLLLTKGQIGNLQRKRTELGPETPENAERHKNLDFNINRLQRAVAETTSYSGGHQGDALPSEDGHDTESNAMRNASGPTEHLSNVPSDAHPTPSATSSATLAASPAGSGLNFTSTEPKQAAHDFSAGRYFHRGRAWKSSSLLERQQPEDLIEPWIPMSPELNEGVAAVHKNACTPSEEYHLPHHAGGMMAASSRGNAEDAGDSEPHAGTEAPSTNDAAKNQAQDPSALDFSQTSSCPSTNTDANEPAGTMAGQEQDVVIEYAIPPGDLKNALVASQNSAASYWRYSMYKNAEGEAPTRHYCTTYEQTEAQLAKFVGEKVVGFDLEWEMRSRPGVSSAKRCVSLMQIAAQDKVALFHLALFRGRDSADELLPPSLRAFLENPEIVKTGVNIGGDATRIKNCFGVQTRGCLELSHLHSLVKFGETAPQRVNRKLVSLGAQVQDILHLPLAKGNVRTSSWSKRLDSRQIDYAASDAYAGLRLYYELERKRKAMSSKPPRPAFQELGLPIFLGEGIELPSKQKRAKLAAAAEDEPTDDLDAAQELDDDDDGEASEDNNDVFFDATEDPEDPYLDSQDASDAALPEITYPTLPSLASPPNPLEDETSSLPLRPPPNPKTPSPSHKRAIPRIQHRRRLGARRAQIPPHPAPAPRLPHLAPPEFQPERNGCPAAQRTPCSFDGGDVCC
ncbi:hypothetical protein Q7P37_002664 [Cladosporium fusiforme]